MPSGVDRGPIPALIARLEQRLQWGDQKKISLALAMVATAVKRAKGDESDDAAKAGVFCHYLREYPTWAVEKACDQWIKTQKFWPAVAELRALCDDAVRLDRIRLARLKKIRDTPPEPEITRTPEQIAEVSRLTADTVRALRSPERKRA